MRYRLPLLPAVVALLAVNALLTGSAAGAVAASRIDLPGGSLGQAVAALGQQADVSISVADAVLWQRRVARVRGRMTVGEALRRLVGSSGVEIAALDARTWRVALRQRPETPAATPARPPTPPPAAKPVTAVLEDAAIIVTASKRDMRLGSYPGGASILDGGDLAFGGERGTDAVLSRLATVSSTHLGAGRNKLFIRGIADSSFTGPTQATVGQYLGDIRLTYNAPDPDLRLYDIASVEVLEGPQATLYGAGSLGGIIRIVRNPPKLGVTEGAVSMGASVTQHGAPGGDFGGTVNLPLAGDRLALRVVGYGVSDGGYIDDPRRHLNDINRTRTLGSRVTLRLDAGDDWTVDLGGTIQHIDGDDSQYADRAAPPLTHSSRFAQGFEARYALADLVVAKRWDGLRLLSSTGVAGQQLFERFDASASDGPDRLFTQANHTLLVSNETRLWRPMQDGFGWVIGGSLLHNSTRLNRALGPLAAPVPVTGVTNSIDEATVFGEASYAPLPWLTVTAGGRWTRARLSGAGEDLDPSTVSKVTQLVELARAQVTADRIETRFLPSLAVSLAPATGFVVFGRYQQGFRPGGLTVDGDFVRRFRNDRVATLEAGARYADADIFEASATLAATRWRDIQADFVDAEGLPTTANIGDGRIYSLAVRVGWRPVAALRIDAGLTYNDSLVTAPSPVFAAELARTAAVAFAPAAASAFLALQMSQIPNVARYAARIGVDYVTRVGGNLDLHVGATGQYIGRSRLGIGPVLGAEQGDYFDSSLTMRIGRPGLGVTLGVTNLADIVGNRFALGTPFSENGQGQVTPLRPRTLRLGLDTRF